MIVLGETDCRITRHFATFRVLCLQRILSVPIVPHPFLAQPMLDRIFKLVGLLNTSTQEWLNDNTFRMAAALAFYTIFSLAPVLMISIGIAGTVYGEETARAKVVEELQKLIGDEGGQAIEQIASQTRLGGGNIWAILFGVGTVIIGSTAVFAELQTALNQIWDVEAHPDRNVVKGMIRDRARSFLIALGTAFLLMVSLVLSAGLTAAHGQLTHWWTEAAWIWEISNVVSSLVIVAILFMMIYKLLPDAKIRWRDVMIGALVTSLLFNVGKGLIGLYLGRTAVGSAYGAAGSFVVLLVWIYYSALICLFGAEFTQVWTRKYGHRILPESHAVRVGDKADRL